MNIYSKIEKDLNANLIWYFGLLITPLVFYFFELSNMSFTQDELRRHSSYRVDPQWLSQGRFGMYFLTWVYSNNPVFPYVGIFLSSVMSMVAIRVFFQKVCGKLHYPTLLSVLFVSCPFLYYLYSFSTVSFSVGVIYLLVTFSVYCCVSSRRSLTLVSVLLLAFSLSIYQSAITVFILMIAIFGFYKLEDGANPIKELAKAFFVLVLAGIVYFVANKAISIVYSGNQSGYIDGFVSGGLSTDYAVTLVVAFIARFIEVMSASSSLLPQENVFQPILSLLFIGLVVYKYRLKNTLLLLLASLALISPFLLEFLSPQSLPTRSYIALPLLFTFVIYWLVLYSMDKRRLGFIVAPISVLFVLVNFINLNKFAYYDNLSWDNDKRLAAELVSQILDLPGLDSVLEENGGKIPLHSVGYLPFNPKMAFNKQFENVAKGFFAWGDNELQNSSNLFKSLGWDAFSYAHLDSVRDNVNEIRKLPVFPYSGSVSIVDKFVVIKFSDYTEAQSNRLCSSQHRDTIDSCLIQFNPSSVRLSVGSSPSSIDGLNEIYTFGLQEYFRVSHSSIEHRDNAFYMASVVSDSFITLPPLDYNGKMIIELDIDYSSLSSLSMYFKTRKKQMFNERQSIRFNSLLGPNKLYFELPAQLFKYGLRIDFSGNPDEFKLINLKVYNGEAS
ncbi:glucosyltransferase domain-containing protein [Enterovibrio calviensis]|uniref:glucosyltransferase domain-containing protein n=1 Tax=Enterovibrio calviensis TaxID=91359 RepID=UPI000486DD49|nr:glucosyltransferase domain-containing protein [Enterovibrio calviensis]